MIFFYSAFWLTGQWGGAIAPLSPGYATGYFHSRPVGTVFTVCVLFLLMIDVAKSEAFRNFTVLNTTLPLLIKLNKTAVHFLVTHGHR